MMHWKIISVIFIMALSLYWQRPNGHLEVNFVDVGQGDGIFIRSPAGYNIVIDGGPDLSLLDKMEQLVPPQEHTIDLLVLTHPHSDHLYGFVEILERYRIKNALLTGVSYPSELYDTFVDRLAEKGANLILADNNKDIYFSDGLLLDVVYPDQPALGRQEDNVNNNSIVLRLVYGQNSILFSGDAELEEEIAILKTPNLLESNILKTGHHGSKTSSTNTYLAATNPHYAVISAGENNQYQHPHQETLKNLKNEAIKILRTDRLGTITMLFDQENLLQLTFEGDPLDMRP